MSLNLQMNRSTRFGNFCKTTTRKSFLDKVEKETTQRTREKWLQSRLNVSSIDFLPILNSTCLLCTARVVESYKQQWIAAHFQQITDNVARLLNVRLLRGWFSNWCQLVALIIDLLANNRQVIKHNSLFVLRIANFAGTLQSKYWSKRLLGAVAAFTAVLAVSVWEFDVSEFVIGGENWGFGVKIKYGLIHFSQFQRFVKSLVYR